MHRFHDGNPETPNPGFSLSVCRSPMCPRPFAASLKSFLTRVHPPTWHDIAAVWLVPLSRSSSEMGRNPSPTSPWATGRRIRGHHSSVSDFPEKMQEVKMTCEHDGRPDLSPLSSIMKKLHMSEGPEGRSVIFRCHMVAMACVRALPTSSLAESASGTLEPQQPAQSGIVESWPSQTLREALLS